MSRESGQAVKEGLSVHHPVYQTWSIWKIVFMGCKTTKASEGQGAVALGSKIKHANVHYMTLFIRDERCYIVNAAGM